MIKSNGTLFFLFLVVFQFLMTGLFLSVRHLLPEAILLSPVFLMVWMVVMFLLPLAIWLGIKKERLSLHMPNAHLGAVNTLLVLGISFFLIPFMALIASVTTLFTPNVAADFMEQTQAHSLWLMLLAVAVAPAVVEEVVFRGYIQSQYLNWPFWCVAVMNGFLFGLIHMNFSQFFYAFFMGVIFAYMVHLTRSIWAGILSHFFLNAVNVVMFRVLSWAADQRAEADVLYESVEITPVDTVISVGIIALIFAPFLVLLWYRFVAYNRRRFGGAGDCS
ncbi:MAG: CPBP family intramembrane metalloprotease [Defluviitaleaceae bacterium]|nr:CPBP family intramembrane metalloprotease [Defluviitaleaceae bacterium]